MLSILQIILMLLNIALFFTLAQAIMGWLISFQVLNIRQPLVAQIWNVLYRIMEPIYRPIRKILPDMRGVDLSPLVVLVIIYALQIIVTNNLVYFA